MQEPCPTCGGEHPQFFDLGNGNVVDYPCGNDHRPDNTGLDDGPPLRTPRKRPDPKPTDDIRDIRARAWATRRQKYGKYGHR